MRPPKSSLALGGVEDEDGSSCMKKYMTVGTVVAVFGILATAYNTHSIDSTDQTPAE